MNLYYDQSDEIDNDLMLKILFNFQSNQSNKKHQIFFHRREINSCVQCPTINV